MMKDFTGGYMGPMYVEKSPGAAAASTAYAILVSAKAKDEESAAQMIELIKENALTQLAAGPIRCTIIPPESEVPGQDKCEVRWCEQFATAEDHAAHKDSPHDQEVGPKVLALMNDPEADYSVIEYASLNHYEKMVEAPSAERLFVPSQRTYAQLLLRPNGKFAYVFNAKANVSSLTDGDAPRDMRVRGTYLENGNVRTLKPMPLSTFRAGHPEATMIEDVDDNRCYNSDDEESDRELSSFDVVLGDQPAQEGQVALKMDLPAEAKDSWMDPDYEE
jgi:hypothetical protein